VREETTPAPITIKANRAQSISPSINAGEVFVIMSLDLKATRVLRDSLQSGR
jgi:hypothetical protein